MRKFFYILPLILLVFLTTDCAYYNTFYNAKKFYKEAEKERKKREKTQVVELSPEEEAQLKKSGRSGQDEKNRASQQEMQNYQQAIERSSRVLEYFPDSRWFDDALMLIGKCFYYRRDYKKAMRKFDEILTNYPQSDFVPETRLLKARTYIGLEEFDTAEEQLRTISVDQDIPKKVREEAKFELGRLYFKKGNYELAAENFESSAKSADDKLIKAMAQYKLGDSYIRLERYEDAAPVLRRAVKIAPNEEFLSQAQYRLGQAYSLSGDYDHAIKTFKTALSKEFDEKRIPGIKLELANNLRLKGDLSEAIKWYDNIIEEHKRTDASARSYFAMGEIEEYVAGDYEEAKLNYDLVRSEFSSSLIAPLAQERSNNIQTLKDLRDDIAKLEGRYVESDSLAEGEDGEVRNQRDDGPIDLSMDGMWVNYSGRDRPPPRTLRELSDTDLARQAVLKEKVAEMMAAGDSVNIDSSLIVPAPLDSAALAERAEQEAKDKEQQLSAKYLALAEVLMFAFDKPDSAIKYYQVVVEKRQDSTHVARALYSLSYVYRNFKADSVLADTVLSELIDIFPLTEHAEGARKLLGMELMADKVDSAKIIYKQAEAAFYKDDDLDRAFELWDKVIEDYPASEFAQKAAYAKAWHQENTLYNLDEATVLYQALVDSFPQSPFIAAIKPKLAEVDKIRKAEEARQKAKADSLLKIETARLDSIRADSLAAITPDSIQLADSKTAVQADSSAQTDPMPGANEPQLDQPQPESASAPPGGQQSEELSNSEAPPKPQRETPAEEPAAQDPKTTPPADENRNNRPNIRPELK